MNDNEQCPTTWLGQPELSQIWTLMAGFGDMEMMGYIGSLR